MLKLSFKIILGVLFVIIMYSNCKDGTSNQQAEEVLSAVARPLYSLPQDVIDSCSVDQATLSTWFSDSIITENGFVNPANSVTFDPVSNCAFYTWSEQMFLWLTSNGSKYGGGATVFESPVFYVVSPVNADNTRTLVPYKAGDPLDATSYVGKADTEEGQATGNVLLDKHGNVVYYISFVNDVYAALLNMAAQDTASVDKFPTTQAELDEILAFAQKNKMNILEPNTLAIELKSSWVQLTDDMNKADFVTISADIPVYDKTSDAMWVLTDEDTTVTLALVGIHIVGSAHGHPEMIWSTFEHKYNAPNAMYQYVNATNQVVNVGPDTDGTWLFNSNPSDTSIANANKSFAAFNHDTIVAKNGNAIQPSNTIRVLAWGSAYNLQPNQQDPNTAYANSQVISINNSIINQLVGNDVRKNYLLIGSTWTFGGLAPSGVAFTQNNNLNDGVAIGTSNLANSTMETNAQESSPMVSATGSTTCFSCHSSSPASLDPKINFGLSHVFNPLMNGLMPKPTLRKAK